MLAALADQALHGAQPPSGGSSTQLLADLQDCYGCVPYVQGTHLQARNSHLVAYGATYYGYAYTRCLAAEVWRQHLSTDPFSSQAGKLHARAYQRTIVWLSRGLLFMIVTCDDAGGLLRRSLLQVGGAKPAQEVVRDLIGTSALERRADGWSPSFQSLLQELDS